MPTPDEIYNRIDDGEKIVKASALAAALQEYHQLYLNDKASVMHYRGSVDDYAHLPVSDNLAGDVYNLRDTGVNYAWDGNTWDELGNVVNLNGYARESYVDNAINNIDFSPYATITYVDNSINNSGYIDQNTLTSTLSDYIDQSELTSVLSNYASVQYVDNSLENIDLDDYASKTYVTEYVNTALGIIENGSY